MKLAFYTFGCKLNYAETSAMGRLLAERGVEPVGEGQVPDICVVNTCSVTAVADKKCRNMIRRLHTLYPDALIVVTGCYAQLKPDEVAAMPGVGVVLGVGQKLQAVQYIDGFMRTRAPQCEVVPAKDLTTFLPSCERGDRTRYLLKVQDGCDYFCSYCTIPYARGRSRSPKIADLVAQARHAAARGAKEIILTGVNIGDFGKRQPGNDGKETFFGLIRALDGVEGVERFRISSLEPDLLTEEIIEWVASESRAFMPHFHIPLQSGSDDVLRIMGRHYDTALFAARITRLKERIPHCFIGVDVMAGTRGESQQRFEESLTFLAGLPVSRLHVFPYSERPGTRALSLDGVVSQEEKHRRVARLTALSAEKLATFTATQIDLTRPVLWEQVRNGHLTGLTDNYLRVTLPPHMAGSDPAALTNTITDVVLKPELISSAE